MRPVVFLSALCLASTIAADGPRAQQANGYLQYDASLPQGWAVREHLKAINAPLPLWNTAKQKLLDGKQIFSHTIEHLNVEDYCASGPEPSLHLTRQ